MLHHCPKLPPMNQADTMAGCIQNFEILVWYGMVWHGMAWHGMACYRNLISPGEACSHEATSQGTQNSTDTSSKMEEIGVGGIMNIKNEKAMQ